MGRRTRGGTKPGPESGSIFADVYNPRQSFITETLTNPALNGTGVLRPGGLTKVCVVASGVAIAAGARMRVFIEGSNDNVNYNVISSSSEAEIIDTTAQVRALGEGLASVVDIGRWTWIRARVQDISGGGTWTVAIVVSGVRLPSQAYTTNEVVTRAAATTNGVAFSRQGGARYAAVQVVVALLNLAGGTFVEARLQGSPDGGTTWITIANTPTTVPTGAIVADGSYLMSQDGSNTIDLGGFDTLRIQYFDDGITTYTNTTYVSTDSLDHLLGGADQMGMTVFDTIVQVAHGLLSVEAADQRNLQLSLLNLSGEPVLQQRLLRLVLSDTQNSGPGDLATNAVFNGISAADGAIISGNGTNDCIVLTSVAGTVTPIILDAAVETVYILAVDGGPLPTNMILANGGQTTVAFA